MKKVLLSSLGFIYSLTSFAGTFTSNGTGGGSWSASSSWSFTGDVDGIPDADDNLTILSGDIISFSVNSTCRNLTVNAGGTLTNTGGATRVLGIYGNYTVNGTETCQATIEMRGPGTVLSGAGHGTNSVWVFTASLTVASNVSVNKSDWLRVYGATTVVTNLGNLQLHSLNANTNGATWIQGANSTIRVRKNMLMNTPNVGIFNASSNPNRVFLDFTPIKVIPPVLNNTFYDLTIPSNRFAQTSADIIVLNDLNVGNNSILNANHNITVGHNFSVVAGGIFTPAVGTRVTFNGTTTQTFTSPAGIDFRHLVINNTGATGVTFSSPRAYRVIESLRLIDGIFNVAATTSFTLVSTGSQTAVVGPSTSAASVTGNIIAQRFVASRAAGFSDMAGSMQGQTLADWNDDLLLVFAYSPPDFYPSVFGYNESAWDYVPVTSATQPLTPGVGFEVYLDSDGGQTSFTNTTISNTGHPNLGTFDVSGMITVDNDGWNLVGNPYHANISWDALHATTSGIAPDIMFYDETIEDFVTVSTGSGELIAPNQGFWVQGVTGAPSMAFTEAIKSTSNSSNFRSAAQKLFALKIKSVGGNRYTGTSSFRFSADPSTALKGDLNAKKPLPRLNAPTLSSLSDHGKKLGIKLLNSSYDEVMVPMIFTVGEDGLYTIEAQNLEEMMLEGYSCALLTDSKMGRTINLTSENYQFYAEKGKNENRFMLKLIKGNNCTPENIAVAGGKVDINRANNTTYVKLDFAQETDVKITITNLLGQPLVPTQSLQATQQTVNLELPQDFSGLYLVNVFYGDRIESKKLFK